MEPLRDQMRRIIESYQSLAYSQPPPPCGPKIILRPIWEEARDIMNKYNIIEILPIQTNLNANAPEWKPSLPPGLPIPITVPLYKQSHSNMYTVPLYKLDANILDKITPLYIKIYEIFVHLNFPEYINIFKLMNMLNIPYSDTSNFINYLNTCNYFEKVSFYNINVKIKNKKTYTILWLARLKHYGYPK